MVKVKISEMNLLLKEGGPRKLEPSLFPDKGGPRKLVPSLFPNEPLVLYCSGTKVGQ